VLEVPCRHFSALVVVLAFVLLWGCNRVDQHWTEDYDRSAVPSSESWDVSFFVTETDLGAEGSRPRLHMRAAYMATFDDDSTYTILEGAPPADGGAQVSATIFDKGTGDTSAVVIADRILYLDRDRRFDASGNVLVQATGHRTLHSERLMWDERSRTVRAPGFVRIETPRERLTGYNLDADEDLDNYRVERVTGEAQIDDEEEAPQSTDAAISEPEDS
jgi:hypothetical protein